MKSRVSLLRRAVLSAATASLALAFTASSRAVLYVPAYSSFITSPSGSETIVTVNDTSGSIATAQTAINAARTANASAVIVINLTAASYSVSTTGLVLSSKECLILSAGTTIQAATGATAGYLVQVASGSSDVSISGGTLNGNGANLNCIQVVASSRVNISSLTAKDAALNIISLAGNGATTFDSEFTVANCTISQGTSTQSGISIHDATQAVIVDNTCSGFTGGSGIYCKDSAYCSIVENTCSGNSVGIFTSGNHNAITDNTCSSNATGISLGAPASGNSNNLCTSNTLSGSTTVAIAAAGTADTIFDNTLSSNTASLTLGGSANNVVPRLAALTSGQNYFYPPLIDDQQTGTIVSGKARTDVTIGATTLSSVQTQYNTARSAHPSDVIVLHLTGTAYTGDATLTLGSYTCVLLGGKITLNSGVTGITASSASYISISGGTIDGGSHPSCVAIDFPTGDSMVQIDKVTIQNFGPSTPRSGSGAVHIQSAATPVFVTRCTFNQGSARGLWLESANYQSVISRNSVTNFNMDGIDCDAHTATSLVKFNTCNNNLRAGIFVEQGDAYDQLIGNTLMGNHRSGLSVWNNGVGANITATQYNSLVCNLCDSNLVSTVVSSGSPPSTGYGLETGSQAPDSFQEATSHNLFFNNDVEDNQGSGQEDADIGQGTLASAQNYFTQNIVQGNATSSGVNYDPPLTGTGGEAFFNSLWPYTFDPVQLSPVGTGAPASSNTDTHTPFGELEYLSATATGQTLTLTTPSTIAGTFQVQLAYKGYTARGECTVKVDGHSVGGTIDQYSSTSIYPTVTLGNVTLAAGTHTIVFTVTGKNASSSAYTIDADEIILVGQ